MKHPRAPRPLPRLTRRGVLRAGGVALTASAWACSEDSAPPSDPPRGGGNDGGAAPDARPRPDADLVDQGLDDLGTTDLGGTDTGVELDGGERPWLSGGTASLRAAYPSPFSRPSGQCVLTCAQALGPCYAATETRQDISDGNTGLPMRLLIRVLRANGCTPVTDATVDIWHTDVEGVYSGQTASPICNPTSRDVSNESFFRGIQPTDADGIAAFDSVLPGWYPIRTSHVHFTIRTGQGAWVTSQLYFDDALTEAIYASHYDYQARGPAPVTNRNDGLIDDGPITDWAKMEDGALLCSTTIILRNTLAEASC